MSMHGHIVERTFVTANTNEYPHQQHNAHIGPQPAPFFLALPYFLYSNPKAYGAISFISNPKAYGASKFRQAYILPPARARTHIGCAEMTSLQPPYMFEVYHATPSFYKFIAMRRPASYQRRPNSSQTSLNAKKLAKEAHLHPACEVLQPAGPPGPALLGRCAPNPRWCARVAAFKRAVPWSGGVLGAAGDNGMSATGKKQIRNIGQ